MREYLARSDRLSAWSDRPSARSDRPSVGDPTAARSLPEISGEEEPQVSPRPVTRTRSDVRGRRVLGSFVGIVARRPIAPYGPSGLRAPAVPRPYARISWHEWHVSRSSARQQILGVRSQAPSRADNVLILALDIAPATARRGHHDSTSKFESSRRVPSSSRRRTYPSTPRRSSPLSREGAV